MVKIGGKKCRNAEFRRRWRLPEDHLRSRSFLEQTQKCYRAANQANDIPQPQQPSAALGQIGDEQYRSEQQRTSQHPRGAIRIIN